MNFKINLFLLFFFSALQIISSQEDDRYGSPKKVRINSIGVPLTNSNYLNLNANNGFENAYGNSLKTKTQAQLDAELKNKGIISPAKMTEERWTKNFKPINRVYKKVDQYLGDFRSNSKYARIICRDYQYPDGDRVTIYINDAPVIYNIVLTQAYQEFKIPLMIGVNKIAFKALNQGDSGPNTAGFKVYDDAGNLISSNEWNLATGAIATLLIVKDN
jgi:hypothetical protein